MNTTPPFGVAMVTRDRCDKLHRTLEDRLHDKIVECRNNIAANQRRLVSVCGEDGKNGKVGAMRKAIKENRTYSEENRRELWAMKLSVAKWAGGSSGVVVALVEVIKQLT